MGVESAVPPSVISLHQKARQGLTQHRASIVVSFGRARRWQKLSVPAATQIDFVGTFVDVEVEYKLNSYGNTRPKTEANSPPSA